MTQEQIKEWRARIDSSRRKREDLVPEWQSNLAYRVLKPFSGTSSADRVALAADWSRTKRKMAQLWSQMPRAILTPKAKILAPLVPHLADRLNDVLMQARTKQAITECCADMINAAGIGAVLTTIEQTIGETSQPDPTFDPSQHPEGTPPPMVTQPTVIDREYRSKRIAPDDLLWPADETSPDSETWPWIGHTGRGTKAEVTRMFGLTPAQVEQMSSSRKEPLGPDDPDEYRSDTAYEYDEIFARRIVYDAREQHFCALQRIVFVSGIDAPVIDEPYKGQMMTPLGYAGVTRFPIQTCALTTISDMAVGISDTQAARAQVDELSEGRSLALRQRRHSIPIRLFNSSGLGPEQVVQINSGEQQVLIPVKGGHPIGDIIHPVPQAQMRPEDGVLQRELEQDLDDAWGFGRNQLGSQSNRARSATETAVIAQNSNVIANDEQSRIEEFFLGIAENHLGLIALFDDLPLTQFDPEVEQALAQIPRQMVPMQFACSILPGSTVAEDAEVRAQKALRLYQMAASNKAIDPAPLLEIIIACSGFNPADLMQDIPPPRPEPINVSIRNPESLNDPVTLAMLIKTDQAPGVKEMRAAKGLLLDARTPLQSEAPPEAPPMDPMTGPPTLPPVDDITAGEERFRTTLATPPVANKRSLQ